MSLGRLNPENFRNVIYFSCGHGIRKVERRWWETDTTVERSRFHCLMFLFLWTIMSIGVAEITDTFVLTMGSHRLAPNGTDRC